jgi:hypothetical protein
VCLTMTVLRVRVTRVAAIARFNVWFAIAIA